MAEDIAPQEYIISNAYPAIVKDTGEQRSFTAHGNTLMVWRLFFEGMDGYYITNRKEDNVPQKGDVVFGSIGADRFGNPTFKSESRPMGMLPTAKKAVSTPTSGDLEIKVDYLVELVEKLAQHAGVIDVVLDDIDDKPIDLSDIPF